MSFIQKFLKIVLPKKIFQKIKEDSEKWFYVCECGFEKSLWEVGGVRFLAYPRKKITLGFCPKCQKIHRFTLVKKDN